MAQNKDYYNLLGVDKSATKKEIKKAYKKLAMKYHPDRAPEEKKVEYEEKFKEISEAASVLGDDTKRSKYDQFGSSAFSGGGAGGSGFQGFDFSDIMSQFRFGGGGGDDIFDSLFGGRGQRGRRVYQGSDLLYEMTITREEAATGTTKTIQINKLDHCGECKGKGGTNISSCSTCNGSGQTSTVQRTPFGAFRQQRPCHACGGEGEVPENVCGPCGGEGLQRKKKKHDVKVPKGIESNMRLRLTREGEAGKNGGPYGNLFVQISISAHKYFERRSDNLHITVPISFHQAVLGDEIEVHTITGKAILKIPKGTDSETIFRMKGKGMPHLRSTTIGDQMVKVHIEVPKKVSKKQKEALDKFKDNPSKGFFADLFSK
mgnify:FL=1